MNRECKNVFLIGFMGSGKSTIARELHKRYGMEWLEMDQEIEKQEGKTISQIFADEGEEYFRELETKLLLSLAEKKNTVVSCGGGVPMRACNVEAMRKSGSVVWLTASPETILERVKNSHDRPLLEGHKDVAYISGLLAQRREKYAGAADVQVVTDNRSVGEIGSEIYGFLGK